MEINGIKITQLCETLHYNKVLQATRATTTWLLKAPSTTKTL